jgi:hypothetical protein
MYFEFMPHFGDGLQQLLPSLVVHSCIASTASAENIPFANITVLQESGTLD